MTELDKKIVQQIEDTLNSFENIQKASPKPYLLTRITAKINNKTKNSWEAIAYFISRPAVMVLGLSLLITVNLSVILINNASKNKVIERSISNISEEEEYTSSFVTFETNETP